MKDEAPINPLKSKAFVLVTILLVSQAVALRAVSRPEAVEPAAPLTGFPRAIADWTMTQEGYVDQETRDVLQADDLLSRSYHRSGLSFAQTLFVASFLSQRNGKAPHSPKNCLPGSGWNEESSEFLSIDVPGGPIEVQHYLVASRDARSDVMYWYQSHNRAVASEYRAKMFVMLDAIRYNRTDTALVRVIAPVVNHQDGAARDANVEFIKAAYPVVLDFLPK